MKVNEILIKQNANQVTDPNTQVSAEEFNALVDNAKESVTSMEVLAGQEEVKLSYGKGKGTSSALTFPNATAAAAGMMSPKQAERISDRTATDGMGYVVLDKDKSFAEQVTQENTIYEIRCDFDLGGLSVPIPKKCIFKFEGGSLSNGTIKMIDKALNYDTLEIIAPAYQIFKELNIIGRFSSDRISIEWFGAVGDGKTDCTEAFRYALKICNNKGYAIRFNANRTYVVKDSINHYDGTDNIVKNISLIGESYIKGGNYPSSGNNAGCIYINAKNTSLFRNNDISSLYIADLHIFGDWVNWVSYNAKFFDNCTVRNLHMCNCLVEYIYAFFYNSSCVDTTSIHDNKIIGVYNFSKITPESEKTWFVDSFIYQNYINGGAPGLDPETGEPKVAEIDNRFFDWKTVNGSFIHHNFIDYYSVIYEDVTSGNINSDHNHYQVFNYFHKNCHITSINDYFNWNDETVDATSLQFAAFKKMTYSENGVIYVIPPYIATDRYYNCDIVFKDMVLEKNIKNVIYRTGAIGGDASKGSFIVELHVLNKDYSNAIVYPEDSLGPDGYNVYLATGQEYKLYIDPKLAHKSDTYPTSYISGAWGKFGIGEHFIVDNQLYTFKFITKGGNLAAGYSLVKSFDENKYAIASEPDAQTLYVVSNAISVSSIMHLVHTKGIADSARNTINNINLSDLLVGTPIILYFNGEITFNLFKDRNNNPLTLSDGDCLCFTKKKDGAYHLLSYTSKKETLTYGTLENRPTSPYTGQCFFDTTLDKPIWWNGSAWVDVTGTTV